MKARNISKIYIHYLKSKSENKNQYHFVLNDGEMLNTMPLFSNSTIDNDGEALHFACINYSDLPERVTNLVDILGYDDAKIIEVTEEEEKPKKKKK